jgi:hypothetical protein
MGATARRVRGIGAIPRANGRAVHGPCMRPQGPEEAQ